MEKKSVKKNYIFNVIYQLLVIIIPIIVTPYVSRVLLPDGVGKYSFTNSIITCFTLFASLGFGYYAQRQIAKCSDDKQKQSQIFWEIIICRVVSVVVSLIINCVLIISGVYGGNTIFMAILNINIVAIAFDISFLFQGNEEFGKLVFINIAIKLLGLLGVFLFVKKQDDVWIYILLNSLILIVSNLGLWIFLRKRILKVNIKELKPFRHFKPSLILFIPTIATTIYTVLDKFLIGVITNSNAQNGFYEQSEKIVKMATTIITCLGTVMISRNSSEISKGNYCKVKENNYKSIHFTWLLGLPMVLGIILVSDNLVPWFLGTDFNNCILLLKLLAPLIIILGFGHILGSQYLLPYEKDKSFTFAVTLGAITNLVLNIPLIYLWGSLGATIATLLSELTVTTVMLIMARKDISMLQVLKLAVKPAISSLVMFAAVYPISLYLKPSMINTLLIALCGVAVYGIAILILKDKFVIQIINNLKNRFFKKNNNLNTTADSEVAHNTDDTNSSN